MRQRQTRLNFKDAARFAKAAMEDVSMKEYYQRKAKKLALPNAYTAALTDYMRKGELHTQIKDTKQGKVVVVYAYKKGFHGGRVTPQYASTDGNLVEDIAPLHVYAGMVKFNMPRNGNLLLTATDDTGHTCTVTIKA